MQCSNPQPNMKIEAKKSGGTWSAMGESEEAEKIPKYRK